MAVRHLLTLEAPVLANTWLTLRPSTNVAADGIQRLDDAYYTRLYSKLPYTTRVYARGRFLYPAFTKTEANGDFSLLDESELEELAQVDNDGGSEDFYELEDRLYAQAHEAYSRLPQERLTIIPPAGTSIAVTLDVSEVHGTGLHICLVNMATRVIHRLPVPNTAYDSGVMCADQGIDDGECNMWHLLSSMATVEKYFSRFESSEWSMDMIESAPVDITPYLLRWNKKTKAHSPDEAVWGKLKTARAATGSRPSATVQDTVVESVVQAVARLTGYRRNI